MLLRSLALVWFGLALVPGCGDDVAADDGSGAAGGSGATGGSAVGGATSCDAFLDEQSTDTVTFRFLNESGIDIYLPANCGTPSYDLTRADGDDEVSYLYDSNCLKTCEYLQSNGSMSCAGACEETAVLLRPYTNYEIVWAGDGLAPMQMPNSCAAKGDGGECPAIVAASAGEYLATFRGYDQCDGDCSCDPDGYCSGGSATGNVATPDEVRFQFPDDNTVEVVFGACAFPCP